MLAVDVRDFAGWGCSPAENAAAINAAVAATSEAASVVLPKGSFDIGAPISLTRPFVSLVGQGGGQNHDIINQVWGTRLGWAGPAGGEMVQIWPNGNPQVISCVNVRGLHLDGNLLASTGVAIHSLRGGTFDDLFITKCNAYGLYLGVIPSSGESRDTQNLTVSNLTIRMLYESEGTAVPIRLDGDAGANTCYNTFQNVMIYHTAQNGIEFMNADNNLFRLTRIYRPSGSGCAVLFAAGPSYALTGRANVLQRVYARGPIYCQGIESGQPAPSKDNWIEIDKGNGTAMPTVGTYATARCTTEIA